MTARTSTEGAKLSILESLKGERRQEFEDFASRYDQGEPWEGISDDEAAPGLLGQLLGAAA